jgi:glyoxylase-like metal-dependent hydrolase (beta-lactamase superfamily II)
MSIQDQLKLVNNEKGFIIDGIEFILTPGHTPGHIVLTISSGSEQLVCTGDLAHHPLEFAQPDLCTSFDIMPEQASTTRIKILSHATTTGSLIFSCHFPFPGLGHVIERERNVWLWQPIVVD